MNKRFILPFAVLLGAFSYSTSAAESRDSSCPMFQAGHAQAASMPHAIKPMRHGAHGLHGKECLSACKASSHQPNGVSASHDATHIH